MEILKFVVIFILLSNVSTFYILQPIDDINSTVVSPPHNTNNATKNLDSPFYYKSSSNKNSIKVEEVEQMKGEFVDVLKSIFHGSSPLQDTPGKVEVKTDSMSYDKSSFYSESPSKEIPRKVEVETDTMNIKSSPPPNTLAKEEQTKVNYVQSNINSVSDKNPLHVSFRNISEKDNKLIATSNETDCDTSTLLCASSQECSHGNVCMYVLIFASSLYFYHTVGAFE